MVLERTRETLRRIKRRPLEERQRIETQKLVREAVYIMERLGQVIQDLQAGETASVRRDVDDLLKRAERLYNEHRGRVEAIPVRVDVYEVIGVDDPETARRWLDEAKTALTEGRVPRARTLLNVLRNELVVETDLLALDVLRDSLRLAQDFLQRDQWARFLESLRLLLAAPERVRTILPKPLIEARHLVTEALSKQSQDPEQARELVQEVRRRVELARLLGYATEAQTQDLLKQVGEVEQRLAKAEVSTEQLQALRREIETTEERQREPVQAQQEEPASPSIQAEGEAPNGPTPQQEGNRNASSA